MKLDSDYFDNQWRMDYERNLTQIRNKKKLKANQLLKPKQKQIPRSMLLHTTAQQLQPQQPVQDKPEKKTLVKVEDLPILLSRMIIKKNVKKFINNIKRNRREQIATVCTNFNTDMFQERLNKNKFQSKKFSLLKLEGIAFSDKFHLTLYLVTFFSYFYMNLLSTFQCFLHEFRDTQGDLIWIKASQIICLLILISKIIYNCIIQKNINGCKIIHIVYIAKSYLFSLGFLIDILLVISIILMLRISNRVQSAMIVYFVSLFQIAAQDRIDYAVTKHLLLSNTTKQYYSLIRLLLANFFFAHLFGSIFLALASLENGFDWLVKYGIQTQYWFDQYIYSVYWATTILTTVGFGDITPTNHIQAMVLIVVMLVGCLILSYNISQVANIFNNLMDRRDELQSQLFSLKMLKSLSKIDEELQKRIADYLINSFQIKYRFRQQEVKALLSKLPQNLRDQYMYQSSTAFFSKMPFFYLLKSQTKKLLVQKMNMDILPPSQYLTHSLHNRHGFRKIYALRYGKLRLCYKKRGSTLNGYPVDSITVDINDFPALLNAFLLNRKSKLNYSIICQTFCNMASLEYDEFRACLKSVSMDFQLWRQIYDSDSSLSQGWCYKKCEECNQQHSKFNCPRLVFIPFRSFVYLKKNHQKHENQHQLIKHHSRHHYQYMRSYLHQIRQHKKFAKKSPLRYWKRLFVPLEKSFLSINKQLNMKKAESQYNKNFSIKEIPNKQKKLKPSKKGRKNLNIIFGRISLDQQHFQVDIPYDFDNYFEKCNPKRLVKIDLTQYEIPFSMFRMAST